MIFDTSPKYILLTTAQEDFFLLFTMNILKLTHVNFLSVFNVSI